MKCEYCDKEIFIGTKSKTRSGHLFCSYACFEDYFGGDIDENDELDQIADGLCAHCGGQFISDDPEIAEQMLCDRCNREINENAEIIGWGKGE